MFSDGLLAAFLYGFGSFLSVYLALQFFTKRRIQQFQGDIDGRVLVFLLNGNELVDANFSGRRLLEHAGYNGSEFDRLRHHLALNFDDANRILASAHEHGELRIISRDEQTQLTREVSGNTVRLKLRHLRADIPEDTDIHLADALRRELDTLRANTQAAPFLLWRQDKTGKVTWINKAYLEKAKQILGPGSATNWPLPVLFPQLNIGESIQELTKRRLQLHSEEGGDNFWYDCHLTPLGEDTLCTAFQADEAVKSETRRREFTQTLTKTFAELAIGLAIFDRSRRLVLFNPALMDLTNLPSDFLTSRPGMISFLDKLRENRAMPEPRDYRSWRKSIAELEAAAADGTYSETWSLPDGQTYHVTGRPHPDGAVALLFEDISAEMSLTRRFRSELELSQAVIDSMDDAVSVFSRAGQLVISNQAYTDLWQVDHEASLNAIDVTEATRCWNQLTAPTPVWGDFRDFVKHEHQREEWSARVLMLDGRPLTCRFQPLKAGSTLAIFQHQAQGASPRKSLREAV